MADDKDKTLWCGNLHENVTNELLYELFIQAGPVQQVKIPTAPDGKRKSFAFISFRHVESVPYALELLSGVALFGYELRLQFRSGSVHEAGGSRAGPPQPASRPQGAQLGGPPLGLGADSVMAMLGSNGLLPSPPHGGGSRGIMGFNPLGPPMAGIMPAAGFHRSQSAPDFLMPSSLPPPPGSGSPGSNSPYRSSGPDDFRGSRVTGTDRRHDRKRTHDGDSHGSGRWRDHSGERDHGRDRSYERERKHEREHSRERRDGRDTSRDRDERGSRHGREASSQDNRQRANPNSFRHAMSSAPWKRSVPPWQQNQRQNF